MMWMPIETAPTDDSEILVTNGDWIAVVAAKTNKNSPNSFVCVCDGYILYDGQESPFEVHPTHWMFVPELPK